MHVSPSHKKRWGLIMLAGTATIIWLFNVSKAGLRPSGCPIDCATSPAATDKPLKIVTWNILHGFPDFSDLKQRLDWIGETLQEQEADIILLQEVPQTLRTGNAAAYLAKTLGMNYVYARANGNRRAIFFEEGAAVLSRFPLVDPQVWELAPQASFFEHRIVLSVEVINDLAPMTVYATHLTDGDTATNQAQAAHLESIVSQSCAGVCFIGGDFNAQPESPQISQLKTVWEDSVAAHPHGRPGYTCCLDPDAPAFPQLSKRIDYLFLATVHPFQAQTLEAHTIPSATRLIEGQVAGYPSDHLGVLVSFQLR